MWVGLLVSNSDNAELFIDCRESPGFHSVRWKGPDGNILLVHFSENYHLPTPPPHPHTHSLSLSPKDSSFASQGINEKFPLRGAIVGRMERIWCMVPLRARCSSRSIFYIFEHKKPDFLGRVSKLLKIIRQKKKKKSRPNFLRLALWRSRKYFVRGQRGAFWVFKRVVVKMKVSSLE